MRCNCVSEPPVFDLPPPPDPSLIWHLISDEHFEPTAQCSSNQFVSISDIGNAFDASNDTEQHEKFAINILIAIAAISMILLLAVCITVIGRIRRRREIPGSSSSSSSKKMSSTDSILVTADNLWSYNSMKPPVLMYSNGSNAGSRMLHHTPSTLRSYIGVTPATPRHNESTTLRLDPRDSRSAYHTVSVASGGEMYEEIAPIAYLTTNPRMSIRRPPPNCRPPHPPCADSPTHSDGSVYDREITRITTVDSPRHWEDGRESGYGTAPSAQWKSPNGSGRLDSDTQPPNPHTMTYV